MYWVLDQIRLRETRGLYYREHLRPQGSDHEILRRLLPRLYQRRFIDTVVCGDILGRHYLTILWLHRFITFIVRRDKGTPTAGNEETKRYICIDYHIMHESRSNPAQCVQSPAVSLRFTWYRMLRNLQKKGRSAKTAASLRLKPSAASLIPDACVPQSIILYGGGTVGHSHKERHLANLFV